MINLKEFTWLASRLAGLHPECHRLSSTELAVLFDELELLQPAEVAENGLKKLFHAMGLRPPQWGEQVRQDSLPMVGFLPGLGFRLVYGRTPDGLWMVEGQEGGAEYVDSSLEAGRYAAIQVLPNHSVQMGALGMFKAALAEKKAVLLPVIVATVVGNLLTLGVSLYSMQVYDRVIPTQGVSTLLVLTSGVVIAVLLELLTKEVRSAILERALKEIDRALSHSLFQRLLSIRMDQFPASVGTLSSQVRGYESIRTFASSAVLYLAVDIPFAVMFLLVIVLLAGPVVALVPTGFFLLAFAIGLTYRRRIQLHAKISTSASNRKLGLLVETVEGAELVKTTGAGWHLLNQWGGISRETMDEDLQIRHYSERSAHLAALVQQLSYIMLVCTGAYIAAMGGLTMGGLIACSILSGRILAPIGQLPGLLVQWGHAKAALESLERVFALEKDNHNVSSPLAPEEIKGAYRVSDLRFTYRGRTETLSLSSLDISPGEKVGILGVVGAGKSTLLKLLAGLYMPHNGHLLLDGLDIQQISRACLSENIGYLAQETHLFSGTLRSNLLFGLTGVSDQEIIAACQTTGLASLISGHSKGLDLEISEGGKGVSGGQKQLIAFTRLLLSRPKVLLLDEPTSSMDEATEARTLSVLRDRVGKDQTMVLVTHKPALLGLVDRLVVLTPAGIVLDGPRDVVLHKLRPREQLPPTPVVVKSVPTKAEGMS